MALKAGSLVSSIVQKAGTYDQKVIDESIEKLSKKSTHLKGEIYQMVKEQYVDFDSYVTATVSLEQRVQEVRQEYQKIDTQIKQELSNKITQSRDKREEIQSRLVETRSRISLVQSLVDIYQALEDSKTELQSGKYVSTAERLCKVTESMSEMASEGCEAKVFQTLKSEHAQIMSDLTLQLQEKWQSFVSWYPKVLPSEPSLDVLGTVELHLPVCSSAQEQQKEEVILAMKLLVSAGVWEQRVKLFAQKLLQRVLKPLVVHNLLKSSQVGNKGELVLCLKKSSDESTLPQLYDMLVSVFKVIGNVVTKEYEKEWLQVIGEILCPELEELIIAHRLSTSIPRSSVELAEYDTVRARTKAFEESILSLGVGKMSRMSEYADDVNVHFVSQKNQDMLAKARSILLQPIHNAVTVSQVDPFAKLQEILPTSRDLADGTFDIESLTLSFPSCAISQSVQEFVDHLYKTLEECVLATDPVAATQLFHLARNMVDLFCAVLFSHHSRAISDLPRVAALQHNNCMYLAHHLVTLGHQFHSKLPPPLNSQTSTFVDQVPLVRSLGEECFLREMRKHSSFVVEYVAKVRTFNEVSRDSQREAVHRWFQTALMCISKLSKVYLEVLPVGIHHKTIGGLLNDALAEIIRVVLSMEDIAADDAGELHTILNDLMDKMTPILLLTAEETATDSIVTYCKSWNKMRALVTVLSASLLEIVDLWDYGKGDLAKEFSASEIRGLIKALFRNTERRATALNKITS